jgi:endo-1,4-beta-xylanase
MCYSNEGLGLKSTRIHELMSQLLSEGVPVHCVGLQMHLTIMRFPDPQSLRMNMRSLAELGLIVNVSEMDVRLADVPERCRIRQLAAQKWYEVASELHF